MRLNSALIFIFIGFPILLKAQMQSPSEFLGYELGTKFSHHHQILDYFKHLESESENIFLREYGKTYEGRPLMLAVLSSDENLSKLDDIRLDNLRRAKIENGTPSTNVPIVWLSYNVHGNESSSSEASMITAYALLNQNSPFNQFLENTIVIIDPCLNPDGRERYVHYYEEWGNMPFNPFMDDAEHRELWPGGRANHYYFDLNRDWAWQSQVESQQRIEQYNKWMPQIHVDFHEQGPNEPYYFAPAAAPYHELISPWQRSFQQEIGRNHARYFDEQGWLYFTGEFFDLLYPSYGDTYPTFNGAIGMTYEQGGHGMAGLGIQLEDGQLLTLKDRIAHHRTTGLSTVEIAALSSDRLLENFESFFEKSNSGSMGKYKSFVIKNTNEDRINHLMEWLDKNGIEYGKVNTIRNMRGYHYQSKTSKNYTLTASDLVVPANQPKGVLAHILFEPTTKLTDSLTYDITAWGAPYFYGLEAYANDVTLEVVKKEPVLTFDMQAPDKSPYAYISKWNSVNDAAFLADLHKHNFKVRFLTRNASFDGNEVGPSIVITKVGNPENYQGEITRIANKHNRMLISVESGFSDYGPDMGSSSVGLLKKPKVALLGGRGVSSLSYGAVRHFIEQELEYPYTILRLDYFNSVDLDKYNVIILPSGYYGSLGSDAVTKLIDWTKAGGKLILIQGALNKFKDGNNTSLSTYFDDDEEDLFGQADDEKEEALMNYGSGTREWLKGQTPGSIYKVDLDLSHPFTFGLEGDYYSLKTSATRYSYLADGTNAGRIESSGNLMSGFVGSDLQKRLAETLVFGVEEVGRGSIVYFVDDPLFRSFWYEGKVLFSNALFIVGN